MSLQLFKKIVELAKQHSWTCEILNDDNGVPEAYQKIADEIGAKTVLPARSKDNVTKGKVAVVFESDEMNLIDKNSSVSEAILRIHREHLEQISEMAITLLKHSHVLSIRHPELLMYDREDITEYKNQLFKIGEYLLNRKEAWSECYIDCLTTPLTQNGRIGECGAGFRSITIAPNGQLYPCPAEMYSGRPACGHILDGLEIANRQLFTREYSVACSKCFASHCLRCVHLNKQGTLEFCVPSQNACLLANCELEVQAWLAEEISNRGFWDSDHYKPKPPKVCDPYELVKITEEGLPPAHSWRRLIVFDGQPENLQPSMMLDIMHELHGWSQALITSAESGYVPLPQVLEKDILSALRRQTIEKYRDTRFQKGCPTVYEMELAMCRAVHSTVTHE